MSTTLNFTQRLERFATQLTQAYAAAPGVNAQPEAQLTTSVSDLLRTFPNIQVRSEVQLAGIGRPDLGVLSTGLLTGYVELKPPGKGANPNTFTGTHDKQQWTKFKNIPNLLYTDGREWALYRDGERVGKLIRLTDDLTIPPAQWIQTV